MFYTCYVFILTINTLCGHANVTCVICIEPVVIKIMLIQMQICMINFVWCYCSASVKQCIVHYVWHVVRQKVWKWWLNTIKSINEMIIKINISHKKYHHIWTEVILMWYCVFCCSDSKSPMFHEFAVIHGFLALLHWYCVAKYKAACLATQKTS